MIISYICRKIFMIMRLSIVLAALLLVGATAEVKAQFGPQKDMDTKYATELIQPGNAAPDFKMQTLDGKKFQFSKFAKGKTVVLDFWASWCPDCRKDAPEVVRMQQAYKQYGIEFVGGFPWFGFTKSTIEAHGIVVPGVIWKTQPRPPVCHVTIFLARI